MGWDGDGMVMRWGWDGDEKGMGWGGVGWGGVGVVCDLSRLGYTCQMRSVCLRLCTVCFNPLSTLREVPKWRFFVKILRIGVNELRHNNKNVIFRLP
jgi:hypothetical protein